MIAALRGSLAGWVGRGILTWALTSLIRTRLGVISERMERLMARFAAGKLWQRQARTRSEMVEGVVRERVAPVRFWPREFSWLTTEMAHHAAVHTVRIEAILMEPEMVALLLASPQAARIMRPMCRMLGVTPALLRPVAPGAEPVVVVVKETVARVRTKRVPIDWGRIPLPRGVLSAARRAGFKPVR